MIRRLFFINKSRHSHTFFGPPDCAGCTQMTERAIRLTPSWQQYQEDLAVFGTAVQPDPDQVYREVCDLVRCRSARELT